MALNYITLGMSLLIFIMYLVTILLSLEIRRKLDSETKRSFTFLVISVVIVAIRRLQTIFVDTQILNPIPYSNEIVTIGFSFFLLLAVWNFHKSLRKVEERNDILFPQRQN